MSEFQFQKSQRVIVPAKCSGAEGVQAVITAATGFIGREPEYKLEWPACDMAGEDGRLVSCFTTVAESVLHDAQPRPTISKDDAELMASVAYRRGADELRAELELERVHRAAARATSRKSKSRRRK